MKVINLAPSEFLIKDFHTKISGYRVYVVEALQSYNSLIAVRTHAGVILDKATWNYSNTTAKHRRNFLGEGIVETRAKIESGEYDLANLNE